MKGAKRAANEGSSRNSIWGGESWRVLLRLAWPYRGQLAFIGLLALLSTAADLIQPLVYRVAINDVAGLFVEGPPLDEPEPGVALLEEPAKPNFPQIVQVQAVTPPPAPNTEPQAPQKAAPKAGTKKKAAPKRKTRPTPSAPSVAAPTPAPPAEPHRQDYVAPRTPTQTLSGLWWAVALLFATSITSYYLLLASENRAVALGSRIEVDLIRSTFGHVLHLPLGFFARKSTGALAKQIDQSDQVAPVVSAFAQQIAPELLKMVGVVVIMTTQSWRLALVALATVPLYIWVSWLSARRLESGMDKYYEMWEAVSARIQDALAAVKTVKLSGAEQREESRFASAATDAYEDYIARTRLGNRYLFYQLVLSHLSEAGVLAYGGWLVLERRLTPGDVVMFYVYLERLFDPIDSLSSMAVNLQQHLASLRRALRLMTTGGAEHAGQPLRAGPGAIELRDVCFSYRPGREVVHGVSFHVAPGKVTALVGPSGAGKTTISDLLLKLYEPDSGAILVDGQSLAGIDPLSLRREIGVVAADGAVFRATLADNIRYKRPEASDQEVRDAAEAAGLSRMIDNLPDGLATEVGEGGVGLSYGERQRLQIARMLVGQPRILVLDEATANLDYATEADIKTALASLPYRPTMIIIAHRYSMVRDADWVIVIDSGRIVEEGTPQQLSHSGGWFSRLASRQADAEAKVAG